jgi:hypothetical protein
MFQGLIHSGILKGFLIPGATTTVDLIVNRPGFQGFGRAAVPESCSMFLLAAASTQLPLAIGLIFGGLFRGLLRRLLMGSLELGVRWLWSPIVRRRADTHGHS